MSTSSDGPGRNPDAPGRDPYPPTTPAERSASPAAPPAAPPPATPDDRRVEYASRDGRAAGDPDTRDSVVDRERERYGGFKFGAAFFGWLTAVGLTVLLTALLTATGAAIGLGSLGAEVDEAAAENADTIGIVGAIALIVILFVSYFAGGYVAGRMARFNGIKQGIAVWIWAIVVAILIAVIAAVAGAQFDILSNLNTLPRIPVNLGELTVAGIITLLLVLLASLGGAMLGGKTGTRYHRKVDAAGFGA